MARKKKTRGTKHGTGRGKWRVERRRYKRKDGSWSYYYNYRERAIRKKGGRRVIRYKKGGKGRKR